MNTGTDIIILIKEQVNQRSQLDKIAKYYLEPLKALGLSLTYEIVYLPYFNKKKPSTSEIRDHLLTTLLPYCKSLNAKLLYCTDSNYLKVLTKSTKTDPLIGYILSCKLSSDTVKYDFPVIYSSNYQAIFANPTIKNKITLANKTVSAFFNDTYIELGTDVIKHAKYYVSDLDEIIKVLSELMHKTQLTCDIETFSLRHTRAGLGTIAFAWDCHSGICINVEHTPTDDPEYVNNVLRLLRGFFKLYKGKLIFHNATFDIKILIYKLFMSDILDTKGLIEGLEILTRNFDDTRIITYLATNNCGENKLGLKELAHEYVGNYAVDSISDIRCIDLEVLMKYNLIDCLATWYVYDKYLPIMENDEQLEVYTFFKKILVNIIQMELTGMPVDMDKTVSVSKVLYEIIEQYFDVFKSSPLVKDFTHQQKVALCNEKNAKLKKKSYEIDQIVYEFNPNSDKQLRIFLYDYLKYPVIEVTKSNLASTRSSVIKSLINLLPSDKQDEIDVLNAIVKIQEGIKINNTFIAKLLDSDQAPDGWHYLFGSFHLGGTKSGRLSSSNPNLQNLPAGSTYGKLIKSCFSAPPGEVILSVPALKRAYKEIKDKGLYSSFVHNSFKQILSLAQQTTVINSGNRRKFDAIYAQLPTEVKLILKELECFKYGCGWVFYGIDFASLEDRINALITKDENKQKIYTQGYDGHSFRSFSLFPEKLKVIHDEYNKIAQSDEPIFKVTYPDKTVGYCLGSEVNELESEPITKERALVEIVNSISFRFPEIRQEAKAPCFALQYQGTYHTLMKNCGFSESEAKEIETNYHTLYEVSTKWTQRKIQQACYTGYVKLAFGLRLRTPVLQKEFTQTYLGQQEARTAGNAVSGQSYCLLNSRAGIDLQQRVFNSDHKYDIKPSAHIHDAAYGLVRNDPKVITWLNNNIVECFEWQDLPELKHNIIKLTGNLELFYPDWSYSIKLPHKLSPSELIDFVNKNK